MVIFDQLTEFFQNIFHASLRAFRKGQGYQTILLILLEDGGNSSKYKYVFDSNTYGSFESFCLSATCHSFFSLLYFCGRSSKSVNLLQQYLTDRKQQIKL